MTADSVARRLRSRNAAISTLVGALLGAGTFWWLVLSGRFTADPPDAERQVAEAPQQFDAEPKGDKGPIQNAKPGPIRKLPGNRGPDHVERELVRKVLKENLDTGEWEEVRWWPVTDLGPFREMEIEVVHREIRDVSLNLIPHVGNPVETVQHLHAEIGRIQDGTAPTRVVRLKYRTAVGGAETLIDGIYLIDRGRVKEPTSMYRLAFYREFVFSDDPERVAAAKRKPDPDAQDGPARQFIRDLAEGKFVPDEARLPPPRPRVPRPVDRDRAAVLAMVEAAAVAEIPPEAIQKPAMTPLLEAEAVRAVVALSGKVQVDLKDSKRPVIVVDWSERWGFGPLEANHVALLASFPKLQRLDLSKTGIRDDSLEILLWCPELTGLQLSETAISDIGMPILGKLTRLEHLDVSKTKITGGALTRLAPLLKLESLNLADTLVSDKDLANLRGLSHITTLDLSRTNVKGPGIEELLKLPRLSALRVAGPLIGDEAATYLKKLRQLDELQIVSTKITDSGLADIETMRHLKKIRLAGTFSRDARQLMQKRMPRTKFFD